jgi:hypothetical protein
LAGLGIAGLDTSPVPLAPPVISWFINPIKYIAICIITHSYWSYKPTCLSWAPHCTNWGLVLQVWLWQVRWCKRRRRGDVGWVTVKNVALHMVSIIDMLSTILPATTYIDNLYRQNLIGGFKYETHALVSSIEIG